MSQRKKLKCGPTETGMSGRNILIVGWNASHNYGTSLQSLALYRILSARYGCSLLWERRRLPLRSIVRHLRVRSNGSHAAKSDVQKQQRIADCYSATDKTYINSRKQLAAALERFSVFLVGGDQLWNPYLLENTYLLDFVPDRKRKISYATSVGMARLPDFAIPRYKKYLGRFDSISMRDVAGSKAMSDAVGKHIDVAADPVFLPTADEWAEFADIRSDGTVERYALFYFVGDGLDNRLKAIELARKMDMPVVIVPMRECDFTIGGKTESGVGPKEFLRLVKGAAHIFTDSYHMCAFSIMFEKSFSVFRRFPSDSPYDPNCRVDELLSSFGIGKEVCTVEPNAQDVARYRAKIAADRERSLEILFGAVEGENHG